VWSEGGKSREKSDRSLQGKRKGRALRYSEYVIVIHGNVVLLYYCNIEIRAPNWCLTPCEVTPISYHSLTRLSMISESGMSQSKVYLDRL
jgi:hypothetical protein